LGPIFTQNTLSPSLLAIFRRMLVTCIRPDDRSNFGLTSQFSKKKKGMAATFHYSNQKKIYPHFYYYFIGAHAKYRNPTTTFSGRTVMAVERKKRERKSQ
jgi:hypothetical protein